MNFGQAREELKKGNEVRREGWNGSGVFIKLTSQSSYPIAINPKTPKARVPWFASQTDMLADDWVVVKAE